MKHSLFLSVLVCLCFFVASVAHATSSSLEGRVLLQVESHGEAWYVIPEEGERTYLADGDAAFSLLRSYGLGITTGDLDKIPIGVDDRLVSFDSDGDGLSDELEEAIGTSVFDYDTDGDGYGDGEELRSGYEPLATGGVALVVDEGLSERLKGYILLQVERKGEAWYVHPDDGKRYYMKDGDAAYEIMRTLSLGITNADLYAIPEKGDVLDCAYDTDCFASAFDSHASASVIVDTHLTDGLYARGKHSYNPNSTEDLLSEYYDEDYTFEFLEVFFVDSMSDRIDTSDEEVIASGVATMTALLEGSYDKCYFNDHELFKTYLSGLLADEYVNLVSSSDLENDNVATCSKVNPITKDFYSGLTE